MDPDIRKLLSATPAIFAAGLQGHQPIHGVIHTIETEGRPVFAKVRQLDPDKLAQAKAEFSALEKAGIVHCSDRH